MGRPTKTKEGIELAANGGNLTAVLAQRERTVPDQLARLIGAPLVTVQSSLGARGWPSVEVLPPFLRHSHFNTDADGLVVVVDSDDSPVHTAKHEALVISILTAGSAG